MKIVLASSNEHKVKEINAIIAGSDIEFILPPAGFDPDETGRTFEENSLIKAQAAWDMTHTWVLADDSGLCIDYLSGAPGIYSARYAPTAAERIERVLKELEGVKNRDAHFECAMTLLNPSGEIEFKFAGICNGSIALSQSGNNGFGYDPIFVLEGTDKTMAELSEDEKNTVSHRAKALGAVLEYIKNNLL